MGAWGGTCDDSHRVGDHAAAAKRDPGLTVPLLPSDRLPVVSGTVPLGSALLMCVCVRKVDSECVGANCPQE